MKSYVYTVPARKAISAVRAKVSAATYSSTLHQDLDELLTRLNQILRGWANYFRHGVSSSIRLARFPRLPSDRQLDPPQTRRISWSQIRRRFCDQGWRFAFNGVVFTGASSVAVTRYRYRGNRIPTPWTQPSHPLPAGDQRSRHVESPMPGNRHVGFGGRG